MNQKYTRNEHLKEETLLKFLFQNGDWATKYPLKIIYCPQKNPCGYHKMGVSVSKKNFKRAVDRNYVKRLLRESFRLHKNELYNSLTEPHFLMIIYTGKEIPSFQKLEKRYLQLLEKIKSQ